MWPIWVLVVFMMIAGGLYTLTVDQLERNRLSAEQTALVDQGRIAEGIVQYTQANGRPPESLDSLGQADGFEHIRGSRHAGQSYVRATGLNDGVWQFERAAAWTVSRKDGGASYRSENACGHGDVATASSWCGSPDGVWHRTETREAYNDQLSSQRVRMMRTLQLLADSYSARQAFPAMGNDGASLAPGSQRTLASLSGYSGSASGCSGVHVWQGIPLDCGALFDYWGGPVLYQYQSSTHVILTTETPFKSASGQPVVIASPLQVQE